MKAYDVIALLKSYFMTNDHELLIYYKFWKFTEKVLAVRDANIVNITRVRSDLNEKNPIGLGNIKRDLQFKHLTSGFPLNGKWNPSK